MIFLKILSSVGYKINPPQNEKFRQKIVLETWGAKLMSCVWWTQVYHGEPVRLDLVSYYCDDTKRSLPFYLSLSDFLKPYPSIINSWSLNEPHTDAVVFNWQFFFLFLAARRFVEKQSKLLAEGQHWENAIAYCSGSRNGPPRRSAHKVLLCFGFSKGSGWQNTIAFRCA